MSSPETRRGGGGSPKGSIFLNDNKKAQYEGVSEQLDHVYSPKDPVQRGNLSPGALCTEEEVLLEPARCYLRSHDRPVALTLHSKRVNFVTAGFFFFPEQSLKVDFVRNVLSMMKRSDGLGEPRLGPH